MLKYTGTLLFLDELLRGRDTALLNMGTNIIIQLCCHAKQGSPPDDRHIHLLICVVLFMPLFICVCQYHLPLTLFIQEFQYISISVGNNNNIWW